MGRRRGGRSSLRSGGRVWWAAVSSGRFFSRWSLLAGLPLAVVILAPYDTQIDAPRVFAAQAAALTAAVPLILGLLVVARIERRIASPRVRGGIVVGALIALSVSRPFLNEAVAVAGYGLSPDDGWGGRIVTNLAAWFSVLSFVAISEQLYSSSRDALQRLVVALRTVTDEQRRAARFERESRDFLSGEVAVLRGALLDLLRGRVDFDTVRGFSDRVRSVSHRMQDRARLDLADVLPESANLLLPVVEYRVFLDRLRPPPVFLVGSVFAVASAPFAFHAGGLPLLVVAVPGILGVCGAADLVTRRIGRRSRARARGAAVLVGWSGAGLTITVVALAVVPGSGVAPYIPIVAVPGLAVAAALSADALHRARVETRRLGRALRTVARSAAVQAAGTRQSLEYASDVLHGRVQGTCVMLAARVDDDDATSDDIRRFEQAVGAAFDTVLQVDADVRPLGLEEAVAVWQPVLAVESAIDDDAAGALEDPVVSLRVVAVVAEGLVNAVKHSAARSATVDVVSQPEDGTVRVSVSSPGELRPRILSSGRGVASLGASARVYQRGSEVVLEVSVPLSPARVAVAS